MPKDLIDSFRSGDELTANLVDAILRELQRLRKMNAAAPLAIDNADGGGPPLFWMLDDDNIVPFKAGSSVAAGSISSPTSFNPTTLSVKADGTLVATTEDLTGYGKHIMNVPINANAIGWGCWMGGYFYPLTWDNC